MKFLDGYLSNVSYILKKTQVKFWLGLFVSSSSLTIPTYYTSILGHDDQGMIKGDTVDSA